VRLEIDLSPRTQALSKASASGRELSTVNCQLFKAMPIPPSLPPSITAVKPSPAAKIGNLMAKSNLSIAPQIDAPSSLAQVPPDPRNESFPQNTRIPKNYVGVGASFSGGTTGIGAISRIAFSDNISLRPSATFGNGRSTVRLPITFDFNLGNPEPFEPNPLASFHAGGGVEFTSAGGNVGGDRFGILGTLGADLNIFDGVALLADFNTNFSDNTGAMIGLGFEF
jgi:hypothetical protein